MSEFECVYCQQQAENLVQLKCEHRACIKCSSEFISAAQSLQCSQCCVNTVLQNQSVLQILNFNRQNSQRSSVKEKSSIKPSYIKKKQKFCRTCICTFEQNDFTHSSHPVFSRDQKQRVKQFLKEQNDSIQKQQLQIANFINVIRGKRLQISLNLKEKINTLKQLKAEVVSALETSFSGIQVSIKKQLEKSDHELQQSLLLLEDKKDALDNIKHQLQISDLNQLAKLLRIKNVTIIEKQNNIKLLSQALVAQNKIYIPSVASLLVQIANLSSSSSFQNKLQAELYKCSVKFKAALSPKFKGRSISENKLSSLYSIPRKS